MKGIMYHYVRSEPDGFPFFNYLHKDDFQRQLDWFSGQFNATRRQDFENAVNGGPFPDNGLVLTFDDGFSDHFDNVLPALIQRKWWGIFYIPTEVYQRRKIIDVHRVHLLIGRYGGSEALHRLRAIIRDDMLSHDHVEDFHKETYKRQSNDESTTVFKRILNYFISYEWREQVLDHLMKEFLMGEDESTWVDHYYLTTGQIREMHRQGMVIGSHSKSHPVFSKLDVPAQRREIADSLAFLSDLISEPVTTFCYPYGGFHSFTNDTERLLHEHGVRYSFNVEARDIAPADLLTRPQALPRYDCNLFPHGRASRGATHPPREPLVVAG